ncbi:helicase [Parabacteroides sp. 52]|uniref:HRDC domain-containing protein n=1 Tax=unclassified Parabacteroides TaxID=2649774 RepID=UPI0013D4DC6C|nr:MULTISPECIES: HRDC domain-containing protein [unclassified Parabacteroides]MDH6534857.1 energy-coupling factor transporter ATP-binding protein EcfA2 [Parabacteroides sp. PM5-20]NDV55574.1 helicase [Parabacteroides sp. 52]
MQMDAQSGLALKFIQNTGTHLFLTGKAGTGKTTFLKKLKALSPKRMIVTAPTGVAAINAGGVTIHSFFQLPFGPYLPAAGDLSDRQNRSFTHKFSRDKINIIKSMDLLVIDEISMVRADLLDAISDVLRRYRDKNKPFGGVQLLLIGDLQQLAPVAKEEEWSLLKQYYASPYFFDSKALMESNYFSIELTHVYRQNDGDFLQLLNKIRDNQPDEETIQRLNERYIPDFAPDDKEGYITLTTHNYQAQHLNTHKLTALPGETYTFMADIVNDFPAYSYPTDEKLVLKTGAQVMFVKNDSSGERKYYNGKIGKIVFINSQKIIVSDEFGQDITVNKETWQNVKYTINEETKEITETIIGSFSQYPLKTAWAITIHKSQGLTFERAIIDAASAFSHGQVYVALSRCKTLDGLVLNSRLTRNALVSDNRIEQYTSSLEQRKAKDDYLLQAQQQYYLKLVIELFDFEMIQQRLQYAAHLVYTHLNRLYPEWAGRYVNCRDNFRSEITEIGVRFQQQLKRMILESADYELDTHIKDRIEKGTAYFLEKMEDYAATLMKGTHAEIDNKENRKLITLAVKNLSEELMLKLLTLRACRKGFSVSTYLSAKAKAHIEPDTPVKKKTGAKTTRAPKATKEQDVPADSYDDIKNPQLYEALRQWRNEQARQKGLPVYTILQQKALIGISNLMPRTSREFLCISGVGKKVWENYGEELQALVEKYK